MDRLRLDVLDAVHVLEPQLELIDEQPFHLAWVEAAKVDEDVDLRLVDGREHINAHAIQGEQTASEQADDEHHHRDRMAQGKNDRVHVRSPFLPEVGKRRGQGRWAKRGDFIGSVAFRPPSPPYSWEGLGVRGIAILATHNQHASSEEPLTPNPPTPLA